MSRSRKPLKNVAEIEAKLADLEARAAAGELVQADYRALILENSDRIFKSKHDALKQKIFKSYALSVEQIADALTANSFSYAVQCKDEMNKIATAKGFEGDELKKNFPNIYNLIGNFNKLSSYIVADIVSKGDINDAFMAIQFWIDVGYYAAFSGKTKDFDLAMAVNSALNRSAIGNIINRAASVNTEETVPTDKLEIMSEKTNNKYTTLKDFLSNVASYGKLRTAYTVMNSRNTPVIPYSGTVFTDVVMTIEGTPIFKIPKDSKDPEDFKKEEQSRITQAEALNKVTKPFQVIYSRLSSAPALKLHPKTNIAINSQAILNDSDPDLIAKSDGVLKRGVKRDKVKSKLDKHFEEMRDASYAAVQDAQKSLAVESRYSIADQFSVYMDELEKSNMLLFDELSEFVRAAEAFQSDLKDYAVKTKLSALDFDVENILKKPLEKREKSDYDKVSTLLDIYQSEKFATFMKAHAGLLDRFNKFDDDELLSKYVLPKLTIKLTVANSKAYNLYLETLRDFVKSVKDKDKGKGKEKEKKEEAKAAVTVTSGTVSVFEEHVNEFFSEENKVREKTKILCAVMKKHSAGLPDVERKKLLALVGSYEKLADQPFSDAVYKGNFETKLTNLEKFYDPKNFAGMAKIDDMAGAVRDLNALNKLLEELRILHYEDFYKHALADFNDQVKPYKKPGEGLDASFGPVTIKPVQRLGQYPLTLDALLGNGKTAEADPTVEVIRKRFIANITATKDNVLALILKINKDRKDNNIPDIQRDVQKPVLTLLTALQDLRAHVAPKGKTEGTANQSKLIDQAIAAVRNVEYAVDSSQVDSAIVKLHEIVDQFEADIISERMGRKFPEALSSTGFIFGRVATFLGIKTSKLNALIEKIKNDLPSLPKKEKLATTVASVSGEKVGSDVAAVSVIADISAADVVPSKHAELAKTVSTTKEFLRTRAMSALPPSSAPVPPPAAGGDDVPPPSSSPVSPEEAEKIILAGVRADLQQKMEAQGGRLNELANDASDRLEKMIGSKSPSIATSVVQKALQEMKKLHEYLDDGDQDKAIAKELDSMLEASTVEYPKLLDLRKRLFALAGDKLYFYGQTVAFLDANELKIESDKFKSVPGYIDKINENKLTQIKFINEDKGKDELDLDAAFAVLSANMAAADKVASSTSITSSSAVTTVLPPSSPISPSATSSAAVSSVSAPPSSIPQPPPHLDPKAISALNAALAKQDKQLKEFTISMRKVSAEMEIKNSALASLSLLRDHSVLDRARKLAGDSLVDQVIAERRAAGRAL